MRELVEQSLFYSRSARPLILAMDMRMRSPQDKPASKLARARLGLRRQLIERAPYSGSQRE